MHSPHLLQRIGIIYTHNRKIKKRISLLFCLFVCLAFGACSSYPEAEVAGQGFKKEIVEVDGFRLFTLVRMGDVGGPWSVFIEGDGHAWVSRTQPSGDPTPRDPVALRLALQDNARNRLYLARPCQYERSAKCETKYWTTHRFAPDVLQALNGAIDQLTGAAPKHLIGYSGGGGMAALLAAKRHDVASLTTYAGNLDSEAFAAFHQVSPLSGSINPMSVAGALKAVPQSHYIGRNDRIIPVHLVQKFIEAQGQGACATLVIINDADHGAVEAFLRHTRESNPPVCQERPHG